MSDRKLLELAAKAAGMVVLERPWNDDDGWFFCEQHGSPAMHFRKGADPHYYSKAWLPLTDDGDALRLAVALRMTVGVERDHVYAIGEDMDAVEMFTGPDIAADTRRIILRAAAQLGKAMP